LVAEAFREQLECQGSRLEHALWDGSISMNYLRPWNLFGQFAALNVGRWLFNLLFFSLPLLGVAPLLGVKAGPVGLAAAFLFVVSLILAVSIGMALEFCFAALMIELSHNLYALQRVREIVITVFSGSLMPLVLMPWNLGSIFQWLPFASMAGAPLSIYTGTGEPWGLILVQMGWVIILWPAAAGLWRKQRERLVCHGG
jgi:ABC-type uncharacterized transport system permease subunit